MGTEKPAQTIGPAKTGSLYLLLKTCSKPVYVDCFQLSGLGLESLNNYKKAKFAFSSNYTNQHKPLQGRWIENVVIYLNKKNDIDPVVPRRGGDSDVTNDQVQSFIVFSNRL